MWIPKIADKSYMNGQLSIVVAYSNGINEFTEAYQVRNQAELDININSRLNQLEQSDALNTAIAKGAYIPTSTPIDPKSAPLATLQQIQQLVSLGVYQSTDPIVLNAISAAQAVLPPPK